MNIHVVSPESSHCELLQALLVSDGARHVVTCTPGGLAQLQETFSQAPDLILFEQPGGYAQALPRIDELTTRYPGVQIVLLSEDQSAEFLRAAMRAGVREVLPLPLVKPMLHELIARLEQRATVRSAGGRGRLYVFIGCKGGVGTTFLATNWAYVLATRCGRRVAVIDLNRQFGDALFYLSDAKPTVDVADLAREAERLDASLLSGSMVPVRPNLHLLAAPDTPEKALGVELGQFKRLLDEALSAYDAVIVDVGSAVDEISALAMDLADHVYPVTQATLPHLRAATRLLKVLKDYSREKVQWIVNRYEQKGEITLQDVERALNQASLRTVSSSFREVCASIHQGIALVELAPHDPVVQDLERWAAAVTGSEPQPKESWIKRWLGRKPQPARVAS